MLYAARGLSGFSEEISDTKNVNDITSLQQRIILYKDQSHFLYVVLMSRGKMEI